jgi:5-(carboxyamino)imidazole ribonucleotide synthase
MSDVIMPGAVIGVMGSGQLGRMFTMAARRLGYRIHVFSPDAATPAGQVADLEVQADYDDLDAVADFARRGDVITFEFENVPSATMEMAARHAPIRPSGQVLHTVQNRLREKMFLQSAGFPVTPFAPVRSLPELETAIDVIGLPGVIKTASWGYDGKGQRLVRSHEEARRAWDILGPNDAVLERWVDFQAEISVVAVRGIRGELASYGPIGNTHRDHILDCSMAPAILPAGTATAAIDIARSVLTLLDVVGVMCIEFFVTDRGDLLINELAPRPHNSGHLTLDAHRTCQFEQQVRAVCGLPLGSVEQLSPAAMANLLGDLWIDGEPAWEEALAMPDIKLHLYGKQEWRRGRKMGHLTALADSAEAAATIAVEARRRLTNGSTPTSLASSSSSHSHRHPTNPSSPPLVTGEHPAEMDE